MNENAYPVSKEMSTEKSYLTKKISLIMTVNSLPDHILVNMI